MKKRKILIALFFICTVARVLHLLNKSSLPTNSKNNFANLNNKQSTKATLELRALKDMDHNSTSNNLIVASKPRIPQSIKEIGAYKLNKKELNQLKKNIDEKFKDQIEIIAIREEAPLLITQFSFDKTPIKDSVIQWKEIENEYDYSNGEVPRFHKVAGSFDNYSSDKVQINLQNSHKELLEIKELRKEWIVENETLRPFSLFTATGLNKNGNTFTELWQYDVMKAIVVARLPAGRR